MDNNQIREDFFKDYRGRYSGYWYRRFGMIPTLPTSLDNSNSIYELLAWLQRAFKGLLDDFINMQLEFEEFKNAIIELLEVLVPELIRQYIKSDEFKDIVNDLIEDYYNTVIKPILDGYEKRIINLENKIKGLDAIIKHLTDMGAFDPNTNTFINGMGIAVGNINLFGGKQDGSSFIKTNTNKNENDLVGGI